MGDGRRESIALRGNVALRGIYAAQARSAARGCGAGDAGRHFGTGAMDGPTMARARFGMGCESKQDHAHEVMDKDSTV